MRLGLRGGEHDHHLIDIGSDDPLALSAAGRAPREPRPAREDLGDRPGIVALDRARDARRRRQRA